MTLTYAKGEAPTSIHGWYVVHTNEGAAGGELRYSLEHETGDGDWVEIDRRSEIPPPHTLEQARGEGQPALSPREVSQGSRSIAETFSLANVLSVSLLCCNRFHIHKRRCGGFSTRRGLPT